MGIYKQPSFSLDLLMISESSIGGTYSYREYPHKIWPDMVQYLHFRILEFPLIIFYF